MACLLSLCTVFSFPSYSQFLPDLQAKTPAEFDAYLDVLDGPAIEKGESFLREFPQSSLLLPVSEIMAKAWRTQGQREKAIDAATRGLALAPDYVPLLVEVADLIANGSDKLDSAESTAIRALDILSRVKAPLRVPPDIWIAAVAALRARAHAAIGLVKFRRNDTSGSIQEFEQSLAAAPDHTVHYRLGRLYGLTGRTAEARRQLQLACQTKDKQLLALAQAALAELP